MIDWDYVWNMKPDFGVIHYREYKDWRQNGNAFETRFSTYIKSNRTMSSYIEGNRKFKDDNHLAGERCMVRGFWGDIVNSPFLSFGKLFSKNFRRGLRCGARSFRIIQEKKPTI